MQLEQLVRIINREPKAFVGAFVLGDFPKTPYEMQRDCATQLGFNKVIDLKRTYLGLSDWSIQGYMDCSFAPILEGDKVGGYYLKSSELTIKKALKEVLNYSSLTGLSMCDIFSTDEGATSTVKMFEVLYKEDDLRVQDIHEKIKLSWSSITGNGLRLEKVGFLYFERYTDKVYFSWNDEKSLDALEEEVKEKLKDLPPNRSHAIARAIEVGNCLYKSRDGEMNAAEITKEIRFSKSVSGIHYTEHVLRILEELGYVIPNSDFRGGERQSKLNLTMAGRGFYRFLKRIGDYQHLPDTDVSMNVVKSSLKLYDETNFLRKKRNAEDRIEQIFGVLESEQGLTQNQINTKVGIHCQGYLQGLIKNNRVITRGAGRVNDPLRYYPNM